MVSAARRLVPLSVNAPPLSVMLPSNVDVAAGSFSVSAPPALMVRWLLALELRPLMDWLLFARLTVTPEA